MFKVYYFIQFVKENDYENCIMKETNVRRLKLYLLYIKENKGKHMLY